MDELTTVTHGPTGYTITTGYELTLAENATRKDALTALFHRGFTPRSPSPPSTSPPRTAPSPSPACPPPDLPLHPSHSQGTPMIVLALAVLAALYFVTAHAVAARPAETTAAALILAGAVLVAMATRLAAFTGQGGTAALLTVIGIAAGALAPVVAIGGTSALKPAGGAR